MTLSHNTPGSNAQMRPIVRGMRRIAGAIRRHRLEAVLSWIGWLLSVAIFAAWTLTHYHAPVGPQWIGMTIRTGVFAIWMLIARTWLMTYLMLRQSRSRTLEDKE